MIDVTVIPEVTEVDMIFENGGPGVDAVLEITEVTIDVELQEGFYAQPDPALEQRVTDLEQDTSQGTDFLAQYILSKNT